jgi:hypothetical protein
MLRLYEMRREDKMRAARDWFVRHFRPATVADFPARGTQEHAYYRQVATYWDMVASLITNGVLNPDLFYQNNRELLLVWVRLRPVLAEFRDTFRDPLAFHNLENVALAYIEWLDRHNPEIFPAFAERIK